jgi:Ni/Co efflux regulator RcnB
MRKLSTGFIHRCVKAVGLAQDYARYLTRSVRSRLADEPVHRVARALRLVLLAALCLAVATPATAAQDVKRITSIDSLKLYAHSRIVNYKEFQCFNTLITKESNWRVEAVNPNGNHFGLGQMRNTKYRNLDGYRMIDWSLRYISHRYSGSSCKAFAHWQKHGWH